MSGDLSAWLSERYAEAQALAQAADPGPWEVGPKSGARDSMVYVREAGAPGIDTVGLTYRESVFTSQVPNKTRFRQNAAFIAGVNPEHRLQDIALKRAILKLHDWMLIYPGHPMFNDAHLTTMPMVLCRSCEPERMWRRERSWPCRTLRQLGTEFSDRPDYLPAWAPPEAA